MQILFIIAGLIAIGIGTIAAMAAGDNEGSAKWTCYPPTQTQPVQTCTAETNGSDENVATSFILAGIGLQIAAAAIAAGSSRLPTAPAMPYAMPGQPSYPPRPNPPTGQLAQPQPTWPS